MMNEYDEIQDMVEINSDAVITYSDTEYVDEQEQWLLEVCNTEDGQLIEQIKTCSPRLAEYTEGKIIEFAKPSNQDQLLRVSFWEEVNRAADEGRQIVHANIYKGICSRGYWGRITRELDWKMTYVLMPIKEYSMMNKLLIAKGQQAMLDILNADPYVGKTGKGRKLDSRIAKVQFEVYKMITERSFGKAVERQQIHHTKGSQTPEKINDQTIEDEIKRMKRELGDEELVSDEYIAK